MTGKLMSGKDFSETKDEEIDDLLSKLTEAEIEELNNDIDPDNHLLPPSQRCRDQTTKVPSGPYDREKLIQFIEEKSRQEKDWERNMPFEKKVRGKIFESKHEDSQLSKKDLEEMGFDVEFDTEFDQALHNATEEELVDLAAVLGFNGMLNQLQYHASLENKEQVCGGFQGCAKGETCKVVPDEPDNTTDVGDTIEKLKKNDSALTEVNLNNLKDVSDDQVKQLCDAVAGNTNLKKLDCANIHIRNAQMEHFLTMLEKNNSLNTLNLESNFITGELVVRLLEVAKRAECKLEVLRLANQQQKVLGVRCEQDIIGLVEANSRLQVLGIDLETAHARIRVRDHLAVNVDRLTRQIRAPSATK